MDTEPMNKLTDAELKIMEVLWEEGDCPAKHVAEVMTGRSGWNVNSTYTLIKRCIAKGAVERREPGFVCRPLITREEVRRNETEKLLERMFDGSVDLLFTALLGSRRLSAEEVHALRQRLASLEGEEGK